MVALLVCAGTFSVGCGKKSTPLRVFTMFGEGDSHRAVYLSAITAFERANKGIDVQDESVVADAGFDAAVAKKFTDKSIPDVFYIFNDNRNPYREKLATVAEVRAAYPAYATGFAQAFHAHPDDPTSLNFLYNTLALFYKTSAFRTSDFSNFSSALRKVQFLGTDGVVDFADEPHYWLNWVGAQRMGAAWAETAQIDKAWFTENAAAIIAVLQELKQIYNGIGFTGEARPYGEDKSAMWHGARLFDVNGDWNAAGFYPPNVPIATGGAYDVRNFVIDDDPATAVRESAYVYAIYGHGWMISRDCLSDARRLKRAADFINTQLSYYTMFSGETQPLMHRVKDIANHAGAVLVKPLDDRFTSVAAKDAFFNGVTALLKNLTTPSQVWTRTVAAFPADSN
ncbi:MAG: hypothetical protein LBM78_02200 [Clostridiales bacterium]|jgi:hypothetical protein|nr:hypothetical protein [Clostridiales bacterium]